MNDKFEQYIESAKRVALMSEEKTHIHAALLSAMRTARLEHRESRIELPGRFHWYHIVMHPLPVTLSLLLAIGASASYAAEGTLPGDTLYPVKTSVNEKVLGWFTFSSQAQLTYEQDIAERRLEEAEQLAFQGRLDGKARAEIAERFGERASRVEEHINKLEDESAVEASSDFEARLKAHGAILAHLTSKDTKIPGDQALGKPEIVTKIEATASSTARQRIKAEAKVKGKGEEQARLAAAKKLKDAQEKINTVRAFALAAPQPKYEELNAHPGASEGGVSLKMMAAVAEDQSTSRTETRLDVAEKVLAEGSKKFEAGAYGEAFILFQKAQRVAEEARLVLQARKDFNIEVRVDEHISGDDHDDETSEGEGDAGGSPKGNDADDTVDDDTDTGEDSHHDDADGSESSATTTSSNASAEMHVELEGLVKLKLDQE
jgi:hypothetical protein